MSVRQLKVGDMQNFVYLLVDDRSGEAMAVDSRWDIDPIVSAAREEKLEVKFAVATHHHSDHAATLSQLARVFDAKLVAHKSSPISHDLEVDDGDILRIGGTKVKILQTPGHTRTASASTMERISSPETPSLLEAQGGLTLKGALPGRCTRACTR